MPMAPRRPPITEMLTPFELQSLKRRAKESSAFYKKAFAELRRTKAERKD
jgi:hypothetical protein